MLSLWVAHAGSRNACASDSRDLLIFVLLGGKPWGLVGGKARVRLVGLVPLRFACRPAARCVPRRLLYRGRPSRIRGSGHHPGPLKGHVVVRGLPGWMGVSFWKVRDGNSDVAWRGGGGSRYLPSFRAMSPLAVLDVAAMWAGTGTGLVSSAVTGATLLLSASMETSFPPLRLIVPVSPSESSPQ